MTGNRLKIDRRLPEKTATTSRAVGVYTDVVQVPTLRNLDIRVALQLEHSERVGNCLGKEDVEDAGADIGYLPGSGLK
jgi:hypothetical protein